jgi:hypothetical protein
VSYFNSDQRDYMKSLAAKPLTTRCWCGWYDIGQCYGRCNVDHPGKSRADFLAAACPDCFTLPPIHRIGCPKEKIPTLPTPGAPK